MGLNFNPYGVLANRSMPLVKCLMWDWMHVYVVSGLFHVEATQLLPVLRVRGATFQMIQSFISELEWPHNLKNRRTETLKRSFAVHHCLSVAATVFADPPLSHNGRRTSAMHQILYENLHGPGPFA